MTSRADRAAAQRPSSAPIDLATKRVLARIKASDAVARAIAELAYRPNADSWQRGRV